MIWGQLMNDAIIAKALALWGLEGAEVSLIAARENAVYRVRFEGARFALRLHRAGYRNEAELHSELAWVDMLSKGGLPLPRPVAAKDGNFCHLVDGIVVDILTWLAGKPMGTNGDMSSAPNPAVVYHALGQSMARMHVLSDQWQMPAHFTRPSWDLDGLLGSHPVWGRFWENPTLSGPQMRQFTDIRTRAAATLEAHRGTLDYGLIHADLVPENVLIDGSKIHLIDFDDGGFGFRLFDIATTLNRARRTNAYETFRQSFLEGYLSVRPIDLELLPLFQTLRALTYVGWIVPRMEEPGASARNQRFISEASYWAKQISL